MWPTWGCIQKQRESRQVAPVGWLGASLRSRSQPFSYFISGSARDMPSHLDISYVPRNIRTLPFHLPSAVFWALSGQIFLTVRRQEKKKENIPDGANKGNAREVVGEGGSAGFLDRRPSPRKRPNGYEHYEVIRRAHPSWRLPCPLLSFCNFAHHLRPSLQLSDPGVFNQYPSICNILKPKFHTFSTPKSTSYGQHMGCKP